MTDFEKLATALGFAPDPGGDHYWIDIDLIPERYRDYVESYPGWRLDGMYSAGWSDDGESYYDGWQIDKDDFRRLMDEGDPLLEKAVRDFVREKADRVYYSYGAVSGDKPHEVTAHAGGYARSFSGATEAEPFAAALIWLAEQAEKEGGDK